MTDNCPFETKSHKEFSIGFLQCHTNLGETQF